VKTSVNLLLLAIAFCGGSTAHAQDALDVTAPSQIEERDDAFAPGEDALRIEFEPVLEMPSVSPEQGLITVSAIAIDGLVALDRASFAEVIEAYAARTLSPDDLARLTASIAESARARGYLFANAWVPPQSLEVGVLRIVVDEGMIDEIRIEGSSDPAIARMLAPLKNGQPVSLDRLERHVLLADDLPGVYLRDTRFVREGDHGVLVVEAYRQDWYARASLSNDGTKPQGPIRARIDVDANGLLFDNDGVDLSLTVAPADPDELVFFSSRYSIVVNNAGTELSMFGSYSDTNPGAYLSDLDIFGESWRAGVRVRHPILRSRDRGVWLEGSLEVQDLKQDRLGVQARHDRIPVARFGAYSFFHGLGGRVRSRVTITRGLNILGATQAGDLLASRLDAQPDFTTLDWWVGYDRSLGGDFSLALNAIGQFSTEPVLIGEGISLGGNFYVRGYDFSTRVGDQGVMGVGELRYDWPQALGLLENMQIYAFADGGVVTNLDDGFGGGSLASTGGGLRADVTNTLDLDFLVAVPLTGDRYDTGDQSPRVHVRVSKSF